MSNAGFWKLMSWAWGLMAIGLGYEYITEGGSTRLFIEFSFILLQAMMARVASKKVGPEGE
jgi:hypothetical protein